MSISIQPVFHHDLSGIVEIRHNVPPSTSDYWERRAIAAEERVAELHDAMRQACEWLRSDGHGRALEVLEDNLH